MVLGSTEMLLLVLMTRRFRAVQSPMLSGSSCCKKQTLRHKMSLCRCRAHVHARDLTR